MYHQILTTYIIRNVWESVTRIDLLIFTSDCHQIDSTGWFSIVSCKSFLAMVYNRVFHFRFSWAIDHVLLEFSSGLAF